MSKYDNDRFDDLVYRAWRSGKNPDDVSRERYDIARKEGFYPDEISLHMVMPKERHTDSQELEHQEYYTGVNHE